MNMPNHSTSGEPKTSDELLRRRSISIRPGLARLAKGNTTGKTTQTDTDNHDLEDCWDRLVGNDTL